MIGATGKSSNLVTCQWVHKVLVIVIRTLNSLCLRTNISTMSPTGEISASLSGDEKRVKGVYI